MACILLCLVAIACWLLAQPSVGFATACACIVAFGFASGIEYDLMGFLVARYFGMRELVWHGDMVFMRDPAGMDLALAPIAAGEAPAFPPWFHFGFRLENKEAVAGLHKRAAEDGVPIREAFQTHGSLSYFRCLDPDGYQIEVYYEPDPA